MMVDVSRVADVSGSTVFPGLKGIPGLELVGGGTVELGCDSLQPFSTRSSTGDSAPDGLVSAKSQSGLSTLFLNVTSLLSKSISVLVVKAEPFGQVTPLEQTSCPSLYSQVRSGSVRIVAQSSSDPWQV